MVAGGDPRADTGQHDNLDFVTRSEGVPQNHGKFALSEGNMLPLCRLALLRVDRSDALFETEKRLVDVRTLSLAVFVIRYAVRSALTARQVDEEKLTAIFDSFFLDLDLADRMAAG